METVATPASLARPPALRPGDRVAVLSISGPADRDWGMRTLTLADPGGYTWEITQELPSGPGSS